MTIPSLRPRTPAIRDLHNDRLNRAPRPMANPGRKSLVMRKYQIHSLAPDGSAHFSEQIGPAAPLFESAFSAFARGTLIKTTQGDIAVEDLQPGMKLITADRAPSSLMWIGSMALVPDASSIAPCGAKLTRVMSESLGHARPSVDFMAGPAARLLTRPTQTREIHGPEKVLTPIRDMVDGVNVIDIVPPRPVAVYHLCLRRHATITAAGLEVETFHPGPGFERTMGPNMLSLFLSLFPHIQEPHDFGSLAHARQENALHRELEHI